MIFNAEHDFTTGRCSPYFDKKITNSQVFPTQEDGKYLQIPPPFGDICAP